MDRRQVLTQCITVPVVAAAGCIGNSEPTIQLAGIRVANFIDEPITVEVVVQRDGSTVQTEDIEVQAAEDGSGSTFEPSPIECTWSDDDAEYVIEARLNDGEWVAREIAKALDAVPEKHRDVVAVELQVYRENEIVFNLQGCDLLTTGTIPPWTCPWVEC